MYLAPNNLELFSAGIMVGEDQWLVLLCREVMIFSFKTCTALQNGRLNLRFVRRAHKGKWCCRFLLSCFSLKWFSVMMFRVTLPESNWFVAY